MRPVVFPQTYADAISRSSRTWGVTGACGSRPFPVLVLANCALSQSGSPGGSRPWAEDLLGESNLRAWGLPARATLRAEWLRFLRGAGQDGSGVWALLVFLAWHAR